MQLNSHGLPVQTQKCPEGYQINRKTGLLNRIHKATSWGRSKLTKTQRKELRKSHFPKGHKRAGQPRPDFGAEVRLKGYNKIMSVLARGCSVSVA